MTITEMLEKQNMTRYRLSKESGVPYATLSDICSGKTKISQCSAETVYRIAQKLHIPMEDLVESALENRPAFELFKSNVCHRLKELGDIDFLLEVIQNDDIETYYEKKWYPESLYLLAMVDYVSRINAVPLCDKYEDLRKARLKTVLYPSGVLSLYAATNNPQVKEEARKNSIPEFMRFNIVENEVRNVI